MYTNFVYKSNRSQKTQVKKKVDHSKIGHTNAASAVRSSGHSFKSAKLSIIELQKRRLLALIQESKRLRGISGRAAALFTLLLVLFTITEEFVPLVSVFTSSHSFRGQALKMLIVYGFIALLASVLIVIIERPAKAVILGEKVGIISSFLALLSGFPLAFLGLAVDQLISSLLSGETTYLTPGWDLLNQGAMLFRSSPAQIGLTIVIACLIPAISFSLLIQGLILPGLATGRNYGRAILTVAVFAAMSGLQLRALPLLILFYAFINKVRLDSDHLLPAALASFSINLGWIIYPLVFQLTSDIFWGQLPGSTRQIITLVLPIILLSAMALLPIIVYYTNNRNRLHAEAKEQAQIHFLQEEELFPKRKIDYLFLAATVVMMVAMLFRSLS